MASRAVARQNAEMELIPAHRKYTIQEYLRLEEYSNVKHEFCGGQIFAMAGGTVEHARYCANVIGLLTTVLRGRRCAVQTCDGRIRVRATGLDTYPDVSVICGMGERDPEDRNAITNPKLLVEVLSPSTEEYDKGEKLEHYKQIPALLEMLFVAHDRKELEVLRREADGSWSVHRAGAGEEVRLESLESNLPVDAVYHDPLHD
jgi:Uma2 family endonuclease